MTEQDLQVIRLLMREELAPIRKDIAELREGQEELRQGMVELREGQEELRGCVNLLLEWADKVSETYQFPLPRP